MNKAEMKRVEQLSNVLEYYDYMVKSSTDNESRGYWLARWSVMKWTLKFVINGTDRDYFEPEIDMNWKEKTPWDE